MPLLLEEAAQVIGRDNSLGPRFWKYQMPVKGGQFFTGISRSSPPPVSTGYAPCIAGSIRLPP